MTYSPSVHTSGSSMDQHMPSTAQFPNQRNLLGWGSYQPFLNSKTVASYIQNDVDEKLLYGGRGQIRPRTCGDVHSDLSFGRRTEKRPAPI